MLKRGTKVIFKSEDVRESPWIKGKVSRIRSDGSVNIHSYSGERFANIPANNVRIIGRTFKNKKPAVTGHSAPAEHVGQIKQISRNKIEFMPPASPRRQEKKQEETKTDIGPISTLGTSPGGNFSMRATTVQRTGLKHGPGFHPVEDTTKGNLIKAIAELEGVKEKESSSRQRHHAKPKPLPAATSQPFKQPRALPVEALLLPDAARIVQRHFRGFLGRQVATWMREQQQPAPMFGTSMLERSPAHNESMATQNHEMSGFDFLTQEEADIGFEEEESFPTPYNVLPKDGLPMLTDNTIMKEQIADSNGLRCFALTYDIGDTVLDDIVNFAQDLFQPEQHHVYVLGFQRDIMMGSAEDAWKDDKLLANFGPAYTLLRRKSSESLYICVVVHKVLRPHISTIETAEIMIGSKDTEGMRHRASSIQFAAPPGAVAISFKLLNKTYLYLNALLTGGHSKTVDRNANIKEIEHKLPLPRKNKNPTLLLKDRFDHVLWLGNLNYRIKGTRSTVMRLIDKVSFGDLRKSDQLSIEHSEGQIFVGYSEGPLNFLPTFKFDIGFQRFDTSSELVVPSWTDRILWTISEETYLLAYDTDDEMTLTHHRPVWAVHHVMVGPELPEAIENFSKEQVEKKQRRNSSDRNSQACRIS